MDDEFAYTSEEGSRQIVYAAIGGTDEEVRGAFTSYSQVLGVSDWILSEDGKKAEDKTWVCSRALVVDKYLQRLLRMRCLNFSVNSITEFPQ